VKLRLAKIDGELNDVPDYTIKGFPAYILYPKEAKQNPIELDVPRNLVELIEYLKETMPAWRDADFADL